MCVCTFYRQFIKSDQPTCPTKFWGNSLGRWEHFVPSSAKWKFCGAPKVGPMCWPPCSRNPGNLWSFVDLGPGAPGPPWSTQSFQGQAFWACPNETMCWNHGVLEFVNENFRERCSVTQQYSKSNRGLSPAWPSRTVLKKDKVEANTKAKAKSEAKPKTRKGENGGGKKPKKARAEK